MQRKPAIRTVTAYEDFAAAIRAKEMSEWLVAQLKPEFQIRSAAWPLLFWRNQWPIQLFTCAGNSH